MATCSAVQLETVFGELKNDNVRTIVLVGKAGVGRTWIARKLSDRAIREKLFDLTLWLSSYEDISLWKSVAHQLSLLPVSDEWEFEDNSENWDEDDTDHEQNEEDLKAKTLEALKGKKFLLILDYKGSQMTSHDNLPILEGLPLLDGKEAYKCIITGKDHPQSQEKMKTFEVQGLSEDESQNLLQELVEMKIYKLPRIRDLAKYFLQFLEKSKRSPFEVTVISKVLNYFGQNELGVCHLEKFKEVIVEGYNVLQLLSYVFDWFPRSILIDCFCIDNHFLCKRGSVYFSELICYWILEAYLDNFGCIEDAYKKGHSILMELMDFELLKQLKSGHVVSMTEAKYVLDDYAHSKFVGTTQLGLASVFDGDLGRVVQAKGMIKTGGTGKEREKISTLMLDVNHLDSEVPNDFFKFAKDLKVLAIFNPGLQPFPLALFEMDKLHLLVLRGCNFFVSVEQILKLENKVVLKQLTVLEISGHSSSEEIPDDLFKHMPHLKSINLSSLQIVSLPSSLYNLKDLVLLILRGCSQLQKVRSLKMFDKLQVLDLSGARSLKTIHDKNLSSNQELRILNLSESQISSLPLLKNLSKLTHLVLRDCTHLERLRKISSLSNLQILDLSGATNFKEFVDPSLKKLTSLKVIDVSHTAVYKLPSEIGNLHQLCIRHCFQLKELPLLAPIKGLQVLDLSGSCHVEEISERFFTQLRSLRVLNLSKTNIKSLPPLSDLHNLHHLLLSYCLSLEVVGELQSATKLEILDLSGCKALKEIQVASFEYMHCLRHLVLKSCSNLKELPSLKHLSRLEELNLSGVRSIGEVGDDIEHMYNLRILDLSDTQIKRLPSLENLKNLNYLSLRDCPSLNELPGIKELTKLDVLDLSGTAIKNLPSLENFGNLHRLLLKGCLSLENFFEDAVRRKVLNATIKELPYAISKVTCLEQLEPPIFRVGVHDAETKKCPPEDLSQFQWSISNWPEESAIDNKLIITLNSIEILQLLKEDPSYWDTSFAQFHFFVHPIEAYARFGNKSFHRNELIFRDLYFKTRQPSTPVKRERSLEIRGFDCFPRCLGLILAHAECVFLVDDPFVTCLSDLGTDNIKKMKACWIERCTGMKDLFYTEKTEEAARSGGSVKTEVPEQNVENFRIGENLEILHVSYATNLKSTCIGNLQGSCLKNLKCLFVEHCPQISAVAASPDQLGNLEILQIRFCQKLMALFVRELAPFPKLHTLKLWALPDFKNFNCIFPALHTLEIGECPMLVNVFSSTQIPESLQNLQIKFCDRMETVFGCSNLTLPNLKMLCLWNLPELKSTGADLPSFYKEVIRGCPKLSLQKRN